MCRSSVVICSLKFFFHRFYSEMWSLFLLLSLTCFSVEARMCRSRKTNKTRKKEVSDWREEKTREERKRKNVDRRRQVERQIGIKESRVEEKREKKSEEKRKENIHLKWPLFLYVFPRFFCFFVLKNRSIWSLGKLRKETYSFRKQNWNCRKKPKYS